VTVEESTTTEQVLSDFYADLKAVHLHPLWKITRQLLTPTPRPRAVPWLWSAAAMKPLAEQAVRLVPVERGGDRRVLSLGNPGLGGLPYAAGTLWAALQCLGPGETAPAHRHTAGAIRFVLEGTGVSTTVNGDPCDMNPGDLVLTPAWNWHDHTSTGSSNMFWFDGLDLPMVEALDAVFFEPYPDDKQPDNGEHNQSEARERGHGRPVVEGAVTTALDPHHSPLLVYRWQDTDRELTQLGRDRDTPMVSLEFVNPRTGASVMPTMSCSMHRLHPGRATTATRRTGNTVFVVFNGSGYSVIDGIRLDWGPGDMFVAPSWTLVEHFGHEQADLFALGDSPVLRALGLYREQEQDARQQVREIFHP
jgi:gentisate 1,2-dioxygenase